MRFVVTFFCFLIFLYSCNTLNISGKGSTTSPLQTNTQGSLEPYERLIGKDAVSQDGLFNIHRVDDNYYFEIADSLLNREILVVTRFIKSPAGSGNYGGEEIGNKTIVFEKGPLNKIFLRIATFISEANEDDAISQAVNNSSVSPILEAFDIKSRNHEAQSSVIEVTKFINSENSLLALNSKQKSTYQLTSLEKDKSYVREIKSFPINIEIRTVKTYKAKVTAKDKNSLPAAALSGFVTLELNNSLILLPKTPMKKRFFDPRVGYFASSNLEYGDEQQKVEEHAYIHRWRLEPRPEDFEKWKSGKLVEPAKPIVFYLDPATPEKWRPYLIQGINDWQKAFEKAGFKNAIIGKEWPENNEGMSLEDARFSVLRYFASPSKNAYGPNITDPRSGEILESHIGWYHNIMTLLHNWYMIQAGAVDSRARKMHFDTDLMGQLVRFVCAHEVGHTLGLRHNMAASYATEVAQLRDADWLRKHGHTSSIMDYARFNYVAQPEDSIPPGDLMPRIGDYDKWAIQWGYSHIPADLPPAEEKDYLNKMVIDNISANPRLWFGGEGRDFDPRSQREDLGNNAVLASNYGIMNLQRIVPKLTEWTKERASDDYSNLDQVYNELVKQYDNYLFHVVKNIGGIYATPRTMGEAGDVYLPVPKSVQKEALVFLDNHIFKAPEWLLTNEILNQIQSPQTKEAVTRTMENVMMNLLGGSRMSRMTFISERYDEVDTYKPDEYLDDLQYLVWGEFNVFYQADTYKRKLQKTYVDNLIALYKPTEARGAIPGILAKLSENYTVNTDVRSLALDQLIQLQLKIKATIPVITHRMTIAHLRYLEKEIEGVIGTNKAGDKYPVPYNPDLSIKTNEN